MFRLSQEWWKVAKYKEVEQAFKERLEFANLTHFDLPARSYAFGTLRFPYIESMCGTGDPNGHQHHWTEWLCLMLNDTLILQYQEIKQLANPVRLGACTLMNNSFCQT